VADPTDDQTWIEALWSGAKAAERVGTTVEKKYINPKVGIFQ